MSWLNAENVSIILFFIGMAGLILRKNMMISVISIGIMDTAIILFFVTMNADMDRVAPMIATSVAESVDPVPHALMLTSVVIGVSIKAIILILILNLYHAYGTLDWAEAKKIRDSELLRMEGVSESELSKGVDEYGRLKIKEHGQERGMNEYE